MVRYRVWIWNATMGEPRWTKTFDWEVKTANFSEDHRTVVISTVTGDVSRWNLEDGEPVGTQINNEQVVGGEFSEDGSRVLNGKSDGTVGIWETVTGKAVANPVKLADDASVKVIYARGDRFFTYSDETGCNVYSLNADDGMFEGHTLQEPGIVDDAKFSPDGNLILTWTLENAARLWNSNDGASVGEVMQLPDSIDDATFSEDGKRILIWTLSGNAYLWDANGSPVAPPIKHRGGQKSAHLSGDGRRVFTSGYDGTWQIWQPADGTTPAQGFKTQDRWPRPVFSPDGQRVLTRDDRSTVQLWNALTGARIGPAISFEHGVTKTHFSPDGAHSLVRSHDGNARLIDARNGSPVGQAMQLESRIKDAQISGDGKRLLTWGIDGTVRLFDAVTRSAIGQPMHHEGGMSDALFSKDGLRVVTWNAGGRLRVWDATMATPCGPPMQLDGELESRAPDSADRMLMRAGQNKVVLLDLGEGRIVSEWIHEAGIRGEVLDRDGKRAATWDDHAVYLWDARTGTRLAQPLPHEEGVRAVMFSKDGRTLLSWDGTGVMRRWHTADGGLVDTVPAEPRYLERLAHDEATGNVLAIYDDGSAQIWSAFTCMPQGQPLSHPNTIQGAVFSPNGKRLFTWDFESARLWNADEGTPAGVTMQHGGLAGASFNADGSRLIAWDEDDKLQEWDGFSTEPLNSRKTEGRISGCARIDGETKVLVTVSPDYVAKLQNPVTGPADEQVFQHDEKVTSIVFGPACQKLVTLRRNRGGQLWDVATGTAIGPFIVNEEPIKLFRFSPSGARLAAWSKNEFSLWDTTTCAQVGLRLKIEGDLRSVKFSPDGTYVMASGFQGMVHVFRSATGTPAIAPFQHRRGTTPVFSRTGRYLLTWSDDGTATLRNLLDDTLSGRTLKHDKPVKGALFREDDRRLLTWCDDYNVRLWDTSTGTQVISALSHEDSVQGAAFLDGGHRLLTWTAAVVRLWDATTGALLGRPVLDDKGIKDPVVSRDGLLLLTRSIGSTVKTWSLKQGTVVHLFDHTNSIKSVRFNKTGTSIVAFEHDHSSWVWDISFDKSIPLEERVLEFEVRSATTMNSVGAVQPLSREIWEAKMLALEQMRRGRRANAERHGSKGLSRERSNRKVDTVTDGCATESTEGQPSFSVHKE